MDASDTQGPSFIRRNRATLFWLILILALAAFFRVGLNYEPAINDGTYRFAGNDDYYHLRVVQHINAEGKHLHEDPLINYPIPGSANPRPPLYDWHVAIAGRIGQFVTGEDGARASAYALEWGSAFWGVLTVIPVWLIGRTLYGNKAGLWAGFLIAASPAHIQRSGFGLGDHDGFIVFFLALGVYFLVRALRVTQVEARPGSWSSWRSISDGFGAYIDHHREGLAYALLAGLCWAAIALMWEGFPYITAIFAIYFTFQMISNHLRRRDASGDILIMLLIMVPVTVLSLPYYWTTGNIGGTVTGNAYVFAGLIILTLALAPTRDLPSIVVLPVLAGLAVLGGVLVKFVYPDIGRQLLSANGYFIQSKIYSTVAEAQRTDLGVFVFSIGFMTFFLCLIGFVYAIIRYFKTKERDQLYLVAWAVVSIYMSFAATRFVFNAAPLFAILAGWMLLKFTTWMNWRERMREFRALRHESYGRAVRSTLGAKQVFGAVLLILTLFIPNLWFSFDAGFPSEVRKNYRDNHPGNDVINNQTGVFGQGFLADDWIDVYGWLNDQDALDAQGNPVACKDRPAHVAWWDYGFWEVALACHPTVSDNFQNGVEISGRFIAAQSEEEAIHWLMIRILQGNWIANGQQFSPAVRDVLAAHNASLPAALPARMGVATYNEAQRVLDAHTANETDAAQLYYRLSQATDTYIGYALADLRMMPIDYEQTRYIDAGSIFYAPIFLADKNPDAFVQTIYMAGGQEFRSIGYEMVDNKSRQLDQPKILGPDNREYTVSGSYVVRLAPGGKQIDYTDNKGQGVALESVKLRFHAAFYQSMFYRMFVGGDGQSPGQGLNYHISFYTGEKASGNELRHFRLVKDTSTVKLLKFYLGAEVSGRVMLEGNDEPVSGALVSAVDEFGIKHDSTRTDPTGHYTLLLPFGGRNETTGALNNVTVRVERAGTTISERDFQVTEAQAMRTAPFSADGDFHVTPGTLEVFAFVDNDRNGEFNGTTDAPASGADLTWGQYGAMTDASGKATFSQAVPGSSSVQGAYDGYETSGVTGTVAPGGFATANLTFTAKKVTVNGTVQTADGTPIDSVPVNYTAVNPAADYTQDASTVTDASGNFTQDIYTGGEYLLSVDTTKTEGQQVVRYQGSMTVDAPIGSGDQTVTLTVTREVVGGS